MAPMIQTAAAVCLVALCSVQSIRGELKAAEAPEAVYQLVNYGRRGKLEVVIPAVSRSTDLEKTLVSELPGLAGSECASVSGLKPATVGGFFVTFSGESPNYPDLIQQALTDGLNALKTYPTDKWQTGIWKESDPAANIAYLLWSSSTQVGCAATSGCVSETKNVMACRFKPTAQEGQSPFDEKYYDALKKRTTPLSGMQPSDLNPPEAAGSVIAVPSVLLGGLVAMLAMASV